jgi:hypothetical protein
VTCGFFVINIWKEAFVVSFEVPPKHMLESDADNSVTTSKTTTAAKIA